MLHQLVDGVTRVVAGHVGVQVMPRALDLVVIGAVGGQEVQPETPTGFGLETDLDLTGVMDRVIIENHVDGLRLRIMVHQFPQQPEQMRKCRDAGSRTRYLIILTLAEGHSPAETARRAQVARSTVYRMADRFRQVGEAGLVDRHEENGDRKLDEEF